jgi:hypothetical protein
MTVHRKIVSQQLTTCDVIEQGEGVRLNLINQGGHSVSIEMTVEQAQSIVMTLPQLLSQAVQARTGDERSRFVFPMGQWSIESTADAKCLIVTLTTTDGFHVAFGIPFEESRALGWALKREGKRGIEQARNELRACLAPASLN